MVDVGSVGQHRAGRARCRHLGLVERGVLVQVRGRCARRGCRRSAGGTPPGWRPSRGSRRSGRRRARGAGSRGRPGGRPGCGCRSRRGAAARRRHGASGVLGAGHALVETKLGRCPAGPRPGRSAASCTTSRLRAGPSKGNRGSVGVACRPSEVAAVPVTRRSAHRLGRTGTGWPASLLGGDELFAR